MESYGTSEPENKINTNESIIADSTKIEEEEEEKIEEENNNNNNNNETFQPIDLQQGGENSKSQPQDNNNSQIVNEGEEDPDLHQGYNKIEKSQKSTYIDDEENDENDLVKKYFKSLGIWKNPLLFISSILSVILGVLGFVLTFAGVFSLPGTFIDIILEALFLIASFSGIITGFPIPLISTYVRLIFAILFAITSVIVEITQFFQLFVIFIKFLTATINTGAVQVLIMSLISIFLFIPAVPISIFQSVVLFITILKEDKNENQVSIERSTHQQI